MQAATRVTRRQAKGASGDAVEVLAFAGDISSTSKDAIMGAYNALDASAGKVLLNFAGVDYINSSGIAIIIQMLLEAHRTGSRTIAICSLTPHFVKVFTMVGVAKYALILPDEAAALEKL